MTGRSFAIPGALAASLALLAGCDGCQKADPGGTTTTSSAVPRPLPSGPAAVAPVVAETLPRCRVEGPRLAIPGDDVVAGDATIAADGLLVGVVRRDGTRRLASIVRASLDLASVSVVDIGAARGDDPPPSPRMRGKTTIVASYVRPRPGAGADAGAAPVVDAGPAAVWMSRVLELARLEGSALIGEARISQQADESLAYDIAWPLDAEKAAGAGIVAWDEDAPAREGTSVSDRGVVKIQVLGAGGRTRVASPDTSDADAPRLIARRGGYWLAWLARRAEGGEDAGATGAAEGPGERRAYRWVELVALDAKGEATSAVRRVSPEKGHVASFDLATAPGEGGKDPQLVVVVQDEAAHAEGAGERIVRYAIEPDRVDGADLLDGGVGHALAELLEPSADAAAPRWLAFTDTQEHAHLVPLGPALRLGGAPTTEPSLDGSRILTSASADVVYAVGPAGAPDAGGGRIELRRLVCR